MNELIRIFLNEDERTILKYILLKKKITQQFIAEKSGVSVSLVNKLINGKKPITPKKIKMFKNCGIDLNDVIGLRLGDICEIGY